MVKYGKEQVKTLEGIEAIRHRPGMYCGSVGIDGLHHINLEILSNSIDEYLAGLCNKIELTIHKDDSLTIKDNGRGVPFGTAKDGSETLENIFTKLHTGAKFNLDGSSGYNSSGGMNGVGSKATNALSEFFKVTSVRDGGSAHMEFKEGLKTSFSISKSTQKETGTTITYKPDAKIFKEGIVLNQDRLLKQLKELSFLCPLLEISFKNEKTNHAVVYKSENGLIDYISDFTDPKQRLTSIINFDKTNPDGSGVSVALCYTNNYSETIKLYTNNIPNSSGTHVTGFRSAMTRAVNDIARDNKLLKEKDDNLTGEDLKEGLNLVISVKMKDPVFSGQTKDVLTSSEGRTLVEKIANQEIRNHFESNLADLKNIVAKALLSKKARLAAKKAREVTRSKSVGSISTVLPGKLSDCLDKTASGTEIFIVEGDSAGGSAKQARNRKTQAILPLRGKVLNTQKSELSKILANKEIQDMITAFGCGIGKEFDYSKLRYEKIIIMSDADVDGEHIKVLLLTFFFNFMEELVTNGNIYVAMSPLYKVTKGKENYYLLDDSELTEFKSKHVGQNFEVQYFKGLGELSPEQLGETTMDPAKRRMKQVTYSDKKAVALMFNRLMGSSVAGRREYIEENAYKANITI